MAGKKGRFAAFAEYAAIRAACGVVNALPYSVAAAAARAAASVAFRVFRFKRRRTLERIRSVFPDIAPRRAREIAVQSLSNVFLAAVEMMRAPSLDRRWMDRHVRDGTMYKERLKSYADEGRGVVVMVPHSGNWYMAAWSMAKYGLPLFAIAARQRNPYIDAWMKRQYGDIDVVERGSARTLAAIKARLEEGRVFAILPDLRARDPDVEVDFLGGKANVSHAGAMFAVKCGCPVVVAAMRREGGVHVFDHLATIRPDPAATDRKVEAVRITREVMAHLDRAVRRNPGDWFWYNKRWILEPPSRKRPVRHGESTQPLLRRANNFF